MQSKAFYVAGPRLWNSHKYQPDLLCQMIGHNDLIDPLCTIVRGIDADLDTDYVIAMTLLMHSIEY